jgi:hypothetical protein
MTAWFAQASLKVKQNRWPTIGCNRSPMCGLAYLHFSSRCANVEKKKKDCARVLTTYSERHEQQTYVM